MPGTVAERGRRTRFPVSKKRSTLMATEKSSKKPAGERKRRGEGRSGRRRAFFNRGFVKNTIRLNETHCLLLMEGAKRAVFPALYYMEGVMPFVTTEKKEIRAVNRMLDELIDEGARKLTEIQAGLDALCKDNAVETALSYDNPASAVSVYVHSPRIARYATLLEPFDRIIATVTSLWLAGVIDEVERSEIVMDGRNAVRRTGNRIINLKLRAWRALNNAADKSLKGILIEDEPVPDDQFIDDPNPTPLPGAEKVPPPDAGTVVSGDDDTAGDPAELAGSDVERVDARDAADSKAEVPELQPDPGLAAKKTDPSLEDGTGKKDVVKPAADTKARAAGKAKTAAKAKAKTAGKEGDPPMPAAEDETQAA